MNTTDFFDNFVVNHPLYQVDKSFMVLINNFRDVFLNETYEILPSLFKDLYEKGEIPSEVYDQILINCGVSQPLLDELSIVEKKIFINTLSNFQKYKSTVGLTESVIKAYGNNFEAYELYVDYNTKLNRWECKPYPIYKPSYNDGYTRTISYRTVYEGVPNLLIHESQLDLMRQQNLAAFPLKTNILFVSSNYNQSYTSYLQNLIISVFYKTYYDEIININFQDQTFEVSLHSFLLIWLYVVFNKTPSEIVSVSGININFNLDDITITIGDLDRIIEEYDQLGTNTISRIYDETSIETDFDRFYYEYIHPLKSAIDSANPLDKNSLSILIKTMNSDLFEYINTQISENGNSGILLLIGDLVKSIEDYKSTTTDINFIKYFRYFKSFLPTIDFLPAHNTVYKILYYVKPYHTDFLDLNDLFMIYSNDKFNNLFFKIFCRQNLAFKHTDVVELEEFYNSSIFKTGFSDIAPISAELANFTKHRYLTDAINFDDDFILLFPPD